jgi:hypothetical protein
MSIKLKGSTDGSVTLQAPADTSPTGTDKTLTLPTSVGSAEQFLKNSGTAGELEYSSMVEDSSANVGIGISSPTKKLHIDSSSDQIRLSDGSGGFELRGGNVFKLSDDGTERLRVDGSGNLILKRGADAGNILQINGADTTSELLEAGITSGNVQFTATHASGGSNTCGFVFRTRAGSSGTSERLRINNTGKTTITGISNGELEIKAGSSSGDDIIGFLNSGGTQRGNITYDTDNNFLFFNVNQTERMRIQSNGTFTNMVGVYNDTTGGSANVNVNSSGSLMRSTSSAKYKTSIETLEDSYADALLNCRPVWYRSLCSQDNPAHGFWGFIAEEVAEIDPRLVHWKTTNVTYDENGYAVETPCDPEAEGVQYERFVPHLVNLIKRQKTRIETLETQNTAQQAQIDDLLARVTALEAAE